MHVKKREVSVSMSARQRTVFQHVVRATRVHFISNGDYYISRGVEWTKKKKEKKNRQWICGETSGRDSPTFWESLWSALPRVIFNQFISFFTGEKKKEAKIGVCSEFGKSCICHAIAWLAALTMDSLHLCTLTHALNSYWSYNPTPSSTRKTRRFPKASDYSFDSFVKPPTLCTESAAV